MMTEQKDNSPDGTLLLRYIRDLATRREKQLVEEWLKADASHEKELLQLAHIYFSREKQQMMEECDPNKAFEKVLRRIRKRSRRLYVSRLLVVAACIAGVILFSSTLFLLWKVNAEGDALQQVSVASNGGTPLPFSLPDGSVAYLNGGSTLTYPAKFDGKERKVHLSGEAYFSVEYREKQPFIVSVRNDKVNVRVLGTVFNVQAYQEEQEVRTTLISGRVDLIVREAGGIQREQSLFPSQQAIYLFPSGKVEVNHVNTSDKVAWIEGKLVFDQLLLPEVLKKLSRFYQVEFDIKDDIIRTYKFKGVFVNKSLLHILEYLKISSDIDYNVAQGKPGKDGTTPRTKVTLCKSNRKQIYSL